MDFSKTQSLRKFHPCFIFSTVDLATNFKARHDSERKSEQVLSVACEFEIPTLDIVKKVFKQFHHEYSIIWYGEQYRRLGRNILIAFAINF